MEDLPDVRLLELFDQLYQTRSVTRAAERLGLAQPTASIWLGRLRDQVDDQLFVRAASGMVPTPRADALIGPCREILESLRRFATREAPFDPGSAQRRFRVAMSDASHITLLPALLSEVRARAPGVRLEAVLLDLNTTQAMAAGEVDLALGYAPWLDEGLGRQRLFEQDWVCLTSSDHPRVHQLARARYEAEGHVNVVRGTGAHLLEEALVREQVERRVVLKIPGILGLGSIIGASDLLATVPRHIGETLAADHGLALHACPLPIAGFTVRQHWHPRYHQEPGVRWLRELTARLFRSM